MGLKRHTIAAKQPTLHGKTTIRYEFAYDGGMGAGGTDIRIQDMKPVENKDEGLLELDEAED